jgi:hypothetical protein
MLGRDASPLRRIAKTENRKELNQCGTKLLSATITAVVVIPRLGGRCLQLWTIFETIMAIAITAPIIKNRSCDDLTLVFPLLRIQTLPAYYLRN